jgi:hypothetical protein
MPCNECFRPSCAWGERRPTADHASLRQISPEYSAIGTTPDTFLGLDPKLQTFGSAQARSFTPSLDHRRRFVRRSGQDTQCWTRGRLEAPHAFQGNAITVA